MKKIRIMLVDDHEVVRLGIRTLLAREQDIEIVAEATTCSEAVARAKKRKPDVVVMDIGLKESSGIDATRQILSFAPHIKVVALSIHDEPVYIRGILQAGACGYVVKDGLASELVRAIRSVLEGQAYVSPEFLGVVVNPDSGAENLEPAPNLSRLSPREKEVFKHTVNDRTLKEIGTTLGISEKTVETHRMRIREKLGITGNGAMIRLAIREGIVPIVD